VGAGGPQQSGEGTKDLLPERWGKVWGVDEEVDEEAKATYLDVFRKED
jgi:hypothetical protein